MPDREVAARLAGPWRAGVDLERRLRADPLSAEDAEAYWRGQIDAWRASIEGTLTHHPFQRRSIQYPPPAGVCTRNGTGEHSKSSRNWARGSTPSSAG